MHLCHNNRDIVLVTSFLLFWFHIVICRILELWTVTLDFSQRCQSIGKVLGILQFQLLVVCNTAFRSILTLQIQFYRLVNVLVEYIIPEAIGCKDDNVLVLQDMLSRLDFEIFLFVLFVWPSDVEILLHFFVLGL